MMWPIATVWKEYFDPLYATGYGVVYYVILAIALMMIAAKTRTPNAWFAWIPILNIVLIFQIAKMELWTLLLLLIPGVNVLVGIVALWKMFERCKKPGWWSLLTFIPCLGFIVLMIAASSSD